jgi:hypothetical protein
MKRLAFPDTPGFDHRTNNEGWLKKQENTMKWLSKAFKKLLLILVLFGLVAFTGCEGTESREQVDDTVEELSGKKNIERFIQMKEDINQIQEQQADHFKQLDNAKE